VDKVWFNYSLRATVTENNRVHKNSVWFEEKIEKRKIFIKHGGCGRFGLSGFPFRCAI
jgi:hypothetical protein